MSAYSDVVLADSPVGFWRLGESTGTTATDLGSGGRNGTYTGSYTLSQASLLGDPTDKCVSLDGSTGEITLASAIATDTGDWTMEAWIYPTAFGAQWRPFFGASAAGAYAFGVSSGAMLVTAANVLDATAATTAPGLNKVSHVGVKFVDTSNALTYYLNGQPNGTSTFAPAAPPAGSGTNVIGRRYPADSALYVGRIDEAAIYPSALSDARMLVHFIAGVTTVAAMSFKAIPVQARGRNL